MKESSKVIKTERKGRSQRIKERWRKIKEEGWKEGRKE